MGWMSSEGPARRREDWKQLISEHKQSGLTVKAFCQKHGVGEALFYCWRKRIVAEDQPARFVLVATNDFGSAPTVSSEKSNFKDGPALAYDSKAARPATAIVIASLVGLVLGLLAAVWHDTWIDRAAMLVALGGVSMPSSGSVRGPVTAYTEPTSVSAGSITIAGQTLALAPGTVLNGGQVAVGSTLCALLTTNPQGQVTGGSITVSAPTTLVVCGNVTAFLSLYTHLTLPTIYPV